MKSSKTSSGGAEHVSPARQCRVGAEQDHAPQGRHTRLHTDLQHCEKGLLLNTGFRPELPEANFSAVWEARLGTTRFTLGGGSGDFPSLVVEP